MGRGSSTGVSYICLRRMGISTTVVFGVVKLTAGLMHGNKSAMQLLDCRLIWIFRISQLIHLLQSHLHSLTMDLLA
jgi:hypothetical protein